MRDRRWHRRWVIALLGLVGWFALVGLVGLVGCSDDDAPVEQADVAVAVPSAGGLRLRLIVPAAAQASWDAEAAKTPLLFRSAPGKPLIPVADDEWMVTDDGRIRIEALPESTPTRLVAELRDNTGALLARAESGAAVVAETEPDRAVAALWLRVGVLTTVQDVDGAPLLADVAAGTSVTALGGGRWVIAGGAPGLAPCTDDLPGSVRSDAVVVDVSGMGIESTVKLLDARSHHGAALVSGGKVALLGGYVAKGGAVGPSAGVELIVPYAGTSAGATVELGRARARFGLVGDAERWLLAGGDEAGAPSVELWSLATGTVTTASLSGRRLDPAAALAQEARSGKLLLVVAGGVDATGNPHGNGELFEVLGDALVPFGAFPTLSPALRDGFWVATNPPLAAWRFGGASIAGLPAATVARLGLTESLASWKPQPELSAARSCSAAGLIDGEVWLIGGRDGATPSAAWDRIVIGAEASAGTLSQARVGGRVGPGPGPTLLLAGGRDAKGATLGLQLLLP